MSTNILIVEDERALSEAYELILKSKNYTTKTAHDGEEALRAIDDFEPEVILLDLRMPRMSGIEFLRQYNTRKRKKAKIVVFSNIDAPAEIDEAYELGADRYVLKAWASPNELLALVKDMLQSQKVSQ